MLMQTHEARLDALRRELKSRELDGFVVPISDEHMSEYVGAYAQRLAWLTGFGGSAGSAVVLADGYEGLGAAMFIDGRYTVQVRDQVDAKLYEYRSVPKEPMGKWLADNASAGARIGYDPWLHTQKWVDQMEKALIRKGITLVPVESNPIDAVWQDRPSPSNAPAMVHPQELAGKSSAEKRSEIAEWLKEEGYDAAVVSALDSIAWLLNIRGTDVDRTPVALSYLVAKADGTAELFIAPDKVTPELTQHLGNAVTIRDRMDFAPALAEMKGKSVTVDPDYGAAAIAQLLEEGGASVAFNRDPAILPKAIKNPVEQQGHRDSQARDGAAVARFLHWLEREAPSGEIDELTAAAKLREFREAHGDLRDLSFDTISAAGPHAALPHYRVDEDSNMKIPPSSIYLVDSGGQYPAGTTDITRTVWVGPGEPSQEMRDRYTRVLKGHIAIDRAVFPQGTAGSQLDAFARQFLWAAGVDYAHGTGHGVGSFLSVHEGPQRIAKSGGGQAGTDQELMPGMILSNEPGYYKAGGFGIRIENLVLVEPREIEGAEGEYYGFDCLTFVPIDRKLVDRDMLTMEEVEWWNAYHEKVLEILAPQLSGDDLAWVERECAPL
ncbi:Xaa-Pro aminopeptidase [Altererythrobacter xiamenensis]|uniref:Xaa-Pro aminopeptidase n=1 Tax=Altererythrobacter xiamenensis TaxID=1316679 RepID=A0A1Y6FLU9_9SPHN|nr:aminopeptidase P family protein [Altererythrobacter xiamenensis]SMQ75888.1 Xaa-Pro aminopeptidase [Altererythrobacter xiamenensis]